MMLNEAKILHGELHPDPPGGRRRRLSSWLSVIALLALPSLLGAATTQWKDADLVASYDELVEGGNLEKAIRSPARPDEAPQEAFLKALAWFAAGMPDSAGTLTLAELDSFVDNQVWLYTEYLKARVEESADNDYPRTRTWKVIQKLALLRDEMVRSSAGFTYPYPSLEKTTSAYDPWERSHTVSSEEDFRLKVCEGSKQRPVLVKYGNTNCTQCMLFELTGSIREFAQSDPNRDSIDVFKVWWGFEPDSTFKGRIPQPALLDGLAKAEGVHSSPYFIVYRDGRRYPCGGAFPDAAGSDQELEACLSKASDDAPLATVCSGVS